MLGSLILYLKGMRRMMLQLSGFYCIRTPNLILRNIVLTEGVVEDLGSKP